MSQGALLVPDETTHIEFRALMNAVFQVLASNSLGGSEPPNPFAGQLWRKTGVGFMVRNDANSAWDVLFSLDTVVMLAGSTMTGPLVLSADPAAANQAARKGYVDGLNTAALAAIVAAQTGQAWNSVSRSSGTAYQNTTGKTIHIMKKNNGNNGDIYVSPDGSSWLGTSAYASRSYFFPVPDGWFWKANEIGSVWEMS